MKKRYVVFGTGKASRHFLENASKEQMEQVICFLDNNVNAQKRGFLGKKVLPPQSFKDIEFDKIIIASVFFNQIKKQLIDLGVKAEQIDTYIDFFSNNFGQFLLLEEKQNQLENRDFSLISNVCWAVLLYRKLGIQYNSPFIGSLIYKENYLKLLNNIEHYLSEPLKLKNNNCDCSLGDIDIQFPHENNPDLVLEKWNRRIKRVNFDNLFVHVGFNYYKEEYNLELVKNLKFKNKLYLNKDQSYFINSSKEVKESSAIDLIDWLNG